MIAVLPFTACTSFAQASPADDSPSRPPPGGFNDSVIVNGEVVTDSRDEVGDCAITYLWATESNGEQWKVFSVGEVLVDPRGMSRDGHEVFCHPVLQAGPRDFPIPRASFKPGWYSSCTDGCSQPFEVP